MRVARSLGGGDGGSRSTEHDILIPSSLTMLYVAHTLWARGFCFSPFFNISLSLSLSL
jgi:hypothetical protein